jgi:hypothetical protein
MKQYLGTLLVIIFSFVFASAQTIAGFSYQKYPVKSIYKGVKRRLNFKSNYDATLFTSKIREGYKADIIDFSGKYITVYWIADQVVLWVSWLMPALVKFVSCRATRKIEIIIVRMRFMEGYEKSDVC